MTREEAIQILSESDVLVLCNGDTPATQAVDMAIEALQAEPTGEYIDKEFELKHYRSMFNKDTPDVTNKDRMNAQIIIEALEMAKTVKVQTQRHGEWIKDKVSGLYTCTACKEKETRTTDYCSNCGAKMDKE